MRTKRTKRTNALVPTILFVVVVAASSVSIDGCAGNDGGDATGEAQPAAGRIDPELRGRAAEVGSAAARTLGATLVGHLQAALAEGGPSSALHVCSTIAQDVSAEVSRDAGVTVRRVSERYRNPADAPNDVERAVLQRFATDAAPADTTVALSPSGNEQTFLYMSPIRIAKPLCLECHGAVESMAPEVRVALAELYPDDLATGYSTGDLRGAFSVLIPAAALEDGEGGVDSPD